MEYLGTKVGPGLAIGKVLIIDSTIIEAYDISLTNSKEIEKEKLKKVLDEVIESYDVILSQTTEKEIKELCEFYKMLLLSPSLKASLEEAIDNLDINSVGAVKKVLTEKEKQMSNLDNAYLRERSKDIKDVRDKIIRKISFYLSF